MNLDPVILKCQNILNDWPNKGHGALKFLDFLLPPALVIRQLNTQIQTDSSLYHLEYIYIHCFKDNKIIKDVKLRFIIVTLSDLAEMLDVRTVFFTAQQHIEPKNV